MLKILFVFVSLISASGIQAASATASARSTPQSLSGAIAGDIKAGDYLVTGTLTVGPGRTLRLLPGARLYFVNFAGLEVSGSLEAIGTPDSVIVLSSSPDHPLYRNTESAQSFDWNGVLVTKSAKRVTLAHSTLSYSTYGLKVMTDSTEINLKSVLFAVNGQFDFTRNDKLILVQRNIPYNYSSNKPAVALPTSQLTAQPGSGLPKTTPAKQGGNSLKPVVQIGLGAVALAGAGMWIGGHISAEDNNKKALSSTSTTEVAEAEKNRDASVVVRNIGIGLAIAGVAGLTITFFF